MPDQPLSFAKDIRAMFTDLDVAHMKPKGMDLSSYDAVKKHAFAIYASVSQGTMPPPGWDEDPWTKEMCATFKSWQDQGCPP